MVSRKMGHAQSFSLNPTWRRKFLRVICKELHLKEFKSFKKTEFKNSKI